MEIRPATADDVPGLLPMVAQICALHGQWDPAKYGFRPHPEARYRGWLAARAADPRSVLLVADRDDADGGNNTAGGGGSQLVGFLVGTVEQEIPIYRLTEYGFVHDLWVEPDYRHEGVGRQLVMRAIERFGQIGVSQIRLDTAAANDPARALFRACGFRPSTTEMLLEI